MGYTTIALGCIAVAAVATAGVSVYSAMNAPDAPTVAPPSAPAGYISYDEDGNATGQQYWDANSNTWVYKPAPLSAEEKQAKKTLSEIRQKTLDSLNNTPAEWETAKQNYISAYKSQAQKIVDEQYTKDTRDKAEQMEREGKTGSRADVDIQTERAKQKLEADTDIADKAVLAGEGLMSQYKQDALNTLNAIDTSASLDTAKAYQQQAIANQATMQGTAIKYGAEAAYNNNIMQNWQNQSLINQAQTKTLSDTSRGLAFLYGYGSGGASTGSKSLVPGDTRPASNGSAYYYGGIRN